MLVPYADSRLCPGIHAVSYPRDNMASLYPFYDARRRKVLAATEPQGRKVTPAAFPFFRRSAVNA